MEKETLAILALAPLLLGGLLYFEKRENTRRILPTKTVLSVLFILTAVIQPDPLKPYYWFLMAALFCCLAGDVLLALPQKIMFLPGLVAFLLGHVFYVLAFFSAANLTAWILLGALLTGPVSAFIYGWLRPHLGDMRGPVLVYVVIISVMVTGAFALAGQRPFSAPGRLMVLVGGVLFYVSDVFVARDRFVVKEFINRLAGLPLYYGGQFLLALSVSFLR
jgi:uncharacterized membrane protein YhhN